MAAPYSLHFVLKHGFLHFRIGGENTPEVTRRYVLDVIEICRKQKCRAILIEENLEGPRMGIGELMSIVQDLHAEFRAAIHLAAFVDVSPERSNENMRFVEDASVNRGAGVAAFPTVADAESWIQSQVGA